MTTLAPPVPLAYTGRMEAPEDTRNIPLTIVCALIGWIPRLMMLTIKDPS